MAIEDFLLEQNFLSFLIKLLMILIAGASLFLIKSLSFKRIASKMLKDKDTEEKKSLITRIRFLEIFINYFIGGFVIISILSLIPWFKTLYLSILAGAGILAIVIGFAAQKTLGNIIAGISIAIYTPFRIGDRIKFKDEFGDIEGLTLRHTVIKTWDNRRIIVPNSLISEQEIINYSIKDETLLWTLNIGISYDSDIDKAKEIMLKVSENHPHTIKPQKEERTGMFQNQSSSVKVTECGDFSVNMRLYFWVAQHSKAWQTSFELLEEIKKQFDKNGIEIPFPYRTIVYKTDIEKNKKELIKEKSKKKR